MFKSYMNNKFLQERKPYCNYVSYFTLDDAQHQHDHSFSLSDFIVLSTNC